MVFLKLRDPAAFIKVHKSTSAVSKSAMCELSSATAGVTNGSRSLRRCKQRVQSTRIVQDGPASFPGLSLCEDETPWERGCARTSFWNSGYRKLGNGQSCSLLHVLLRHTRKKEIRVLLSGVEPKTFPITSSDALPLSYRKPSLMALAPTSLL